MATYLQISQLRKDGDLIARASVAVMKTAAYILNEPQNFPNHVPRLKWAQQAITNPDGAAAAMMSSIVTDPNFLPTIQADGTTTIGDEELSTVVQAYVDIFALARY